ncbi:MAG: long-chain acyl-CoA synthetase [Pseudonocardiales bacterium]|nr:long-chain acyl-CoA synthetase [Pseudonocardiales bacterium]
MIDPTGPKSIGDLVGRAVAAKPDATAVVDGQVRLSWDELAARSSHLAAGLAARGLGVGDRIALHAPTSAEFVTVYLAALRAGAVLVPINPAYTAREVEHILGDAGVRMLVTSSVAVIEASGRLRAANPALSQIIVTGRSGIDGMPSVTDVTASGAAMPAIEAYRTGEELAVLLYTSGTSGRPKGAMLSVRALLANLHQIAQLSPPPVTSADVLYLPLPMFHIFGLNAGLGLGLYYGATMVLADRFDPAASLRTMRAERVTVVLGAPLEFSMWLHQQDLQAGFDRVRLALSGSAPLLPELVEEYRQIGVPLFEGYGLTEACPVITVNLIPDAGGDGYADPKPGSIGRPLPGVAVRLLDEDGEEVEAGDLGVIEVRGENLFSGYWPDGAGGPDQDGWFATGDLAVADDDGDYYLVGRRSDLILVNGFNVYPAEVEAVLGRIEGIREVAVLGEPDSQGNESVVAYVIARAGASLDPEEILQVAAGSLARFKLPKRIVEVEALPRTATGKVMKWRLRAASERATVQGR